MSEQVPVTVIGGYLGAGKTTLVNHLLRHERGRRIAVLVNDFGELPIDADLVESRDDEVISIAGGCVCCSFGSDLVAALMKLSARSPTPEHVLVEASGVALPGAVARTVTLLPACRLDGTVVLADAETIRPRAADRYVGDTVTRQLADADLIVLNKADLVAPEELAALTVWIREQLPRARLVPAQRAHVPVEVLLGTAAPRISSDPGALTRSERIRQIAPARAAEIFDRAAFRPKQALDVSFLGRALADTALGVLRAKGRLRDLKGTWKILHVVGSRYEVSPAQATGDLGGLVCIGLAGMLDRRAIDDAIARAAPSGED